MDMYETNEKIPLSWKGALIYRAPKKDNILDDPTTWRDISLPNYLQGVYEMPPQSHTPMARRNENLD